MKIVTAPPETLTEFRSSTSTKSVDGLLTPVTTLAIQLPRPLLIVTLPLPVVSLAQTMVPRVALKSSLSLISSVSVALATGASHKAAATTAPIRLKLSLSIDFLPL